MVRLWLEALAVVLGLAFGSFLNVCISRLPRGESVVSPRSRCPRCTVPIRWVDNLPLLSWVLLRARCRSCGASIPLRYPLVEVAVAAWFLVAAHRLAPLFVERGGPPLPLDTVLGAAVSTTAFAALGWFLIGLLVTDWQTQVLPDALTFGGIAAAGFCVCLQAMFLGTTEDRVLLHRANPLTSPGNVIDRGNVLLTGPEALLGGRLVALCAAAGVLLLVRWLYRAVRHRQGLGLGDVKLLAMIAAFLGFAPAMLALFLGVVAGAAYAVVLLARQRANATTRLPLGSFLAAGGLVAGLFGQALLGWYKSLL